MNIASGLNAAVYMNKQMANSVNRLKQAAIAIVSSFIEALAMKISTIIVSIKRIMARKLALGLRGYFYSHFFDQDYIKHKSEPGTNPWLIERNIDTLPLKGCYSIYKIVVKVVAQKEAELAKMKVVLPTIKDMNERQRR